MLRRSLLRAAPSLLIPRIAFARLLHGGGGASTGGLSPDGSFIQAPATGNTGAAAGSLRTVWGTASFGDLFAPIPHYGGGQFYFSLLNGVPMYPAYYYTWAEFLFVGFGGNLFGMLSSDQLTGGWTNNTWNGDDGAAAPGPFTGFPGPVGGSAIIVPSGTPTPPALPTPWAGPYTPSADGTAISGGTGTLTSARGDGGVWTFGAAGGGGWALQRQGISVGPWVVTDMQVNSHGTLFLKSADALWHVWNSWQVNDSTGPTAGPVPVQVNFSPSARPVVAVGSADGTLIATVTVTMSDGSPFSGTLAIDVDYNSGTQLLRSGGFVTGSSGAVKIVANGTYNGSRSPVTATQNGSSVVTQINAQ